MKKKNNLSASPLQINPLRNPGESLEKEIDILINEKTVTYAVITLFLIVIVIWEWIRFYTNTPPSPILLTFLAAIIIPVCIYRFLKNKKQLHHLLQGQKGEKIVGQFLDEMRTNETKVFHDIPAPHFNLDHVIISSTGIYVIETKTYSKQRGERLSFNGTHIIFKTGFKTNEPIIQAQAAANWLIGLIKESTGKHFPVKPVVLFPGWYIETTHETKSPVWVLSHKALPAFMEKQKETLVSEDINLAAFHLSAYIRNYKA